MRGRWILLLLAGCAELGGEPSEGRARSAIVGGAPADPSSYPATGVIIATAKLRCTGTLIAPDVVLTAAHCLKPPVFGYLGFTLDTNLALGGVEGVVRALVTHQHPDYVDAHELTDLGAGNDVGVMILERPIAVEGGQYERIELAAAPSVEAPLGLCGYGRDLWTTTMPGVKRTADVGVARVEELELATSAVGPQPCLGDSGAPLFDNATAPHTLVGIVSRAVGENRMCDSGAIVTRTTPYASWIAAASQDRDVGCAGGLLLPLLPLAASRRRRRPRPSLQP